MTPRMALWSAVVTIVGLSNVAAALGEGSWGVRS